MNSALNEAALDCTVNKNPGFQLLDYRKNFRQNRLNYNMRFLFFRFYNRTEKILKPDFDMSPKNMVGLNLRIPIFSGGQQAAKLRQAKMELETMRNNRALLADQLGVQERQLQFNLKNAGETYLNQVKNLEVARRVYKNLKMKFDQGLISGLELVTADNNYLKAETDYLTAVFQLLQARVDLDTLYGNLK